MTLTEMYALLIRFTKDSEGKDITVPELQNLAHWRCVWGWWMALAYYKMNGYYMSKEDVPEGLDHYSVIDEVLTKYWTERGKLKSQVITKADCKSFYGSSV